MEGEESRKLEKKISQENEVMRQLMIELDEMIQTLSLQKLEIDNKLQAICNLKEQNKELQKQINALFRYHKK